IVKLLLEKEADVKAQGGFYGNALQAASARGHAEIVRLLIEDGANANHPDPLGRTSLFLSSWFGHLGVVRTLLSNRGTDYNATDWRGSTAFHAAVRHGNSRVVSLLLSTG
ncbi:ankyrin repeat-containing domain protein, partial [Microdochium trichocladiopsis]